MDEGGGGRGEGGREWREGGEGRKVEEERWWKGIWRKEVEEGEVKEGEMEEGKGDGGRKRRKGR